MKKLFFLSVIFVIAAWNVSTAQIHTKSFPIPSFDFPMNNSTVVFEEQPGSGNGTNEKRDANVVVTSTTDNTEPEFVMVTFKNYSTGDVLGPFTVYLNEYFNLPLEKGRWSAVVTTPTSLKISIWLE